MKIKVVHHSLCGIILLLLVGFAFSCGSSSQATSISATWKDPEAKTYNNFLVVVLTKNLAARSTLELDVARRLRSKTVKVTRSMDVLAHNDKLETAEEKQAAVEKIQSLGHDAIIAITLIKHTEESRYVQGANTYAPTNVGYGMGYTPATGGVAPIGTVGAWGTYYVSGSSVYQTPGYYEKDQIYFVESRVYDLKTSKLIWSAQSESFNPGDLPSASGDFSLVMVDAMKKAGLVVSSKK